MYFDKEDFDKVLMDFNSDKDEKLIEEILNIYKEKKILGDPPRPVFRPKHFKCLDCGTEIWSKYPGHWCACKCGKTFVDQDEYIYRLGGNPVELNIRDPQRISPLMDRIESMWQAMPDLRLGQLLQNALGSDFYYTEDEELVNQIELFYKPMINEQVNVENVSSDGEGTSTDGIGDNGSKE